MRDSSIIAMALFLLWPATANAVPRCLPYLDMKDALFAESGEIPFMVGEGRLTETMQMGWIHHWVNPADGSWTATWGVVNEGACVIARGGNWRFSEPPTTEKPS